MMNNKKQTNFLSIKDQLKESVLSLYALPDYGQVDLNLVNMANFFPLIQGLILSMHPRIICEVGSDQGATSHLLYQFCKSNGVHLHVVDPALKEGLQSDEFVTYFKEKSIPYLKQSQHADIYFIDGDHNYYTVLNELKLIRERNTDNSIRLLFLHDVGWPCGYKDMYYDESSINQEYRKETSHGRNLSVFQSQYVDEKQGLPMNEVTVAIQEDRNENGVLAAVEDFLADSPDWNYFSIPSIYGLGVLWYGKDANQEFEQQIAKLDENFRFFRSFLSILEFNRILLLEKLEESGELWEEQKVYLDGQNTRLEELLENRKELEEKIADQGRLWEQQKAYMEEQDQRIEKLLEHRQELEEKIADQGKLWEQQKAYIEELEKKIDDQGRLWKQQQNYIQQLESQKAQLDSDVMELKSVTGWLRIKLKR